MTTSGAMSSPIVPEDGAITVFDAAAIELRAKLHVAAQAAATRDDEVVLHAVDFARELAEAFPAGFGWKSDDLVCARRYSVQVLTWTLTRRGRFGRVHRMTHPHGAKVLTMKGRFSRNELRTRYALWDPRQSFTDADGYRWSPCPNDTEIREREWQDPIRLMTAAGLKKFALDAPLIAEQLAEQLTAAEQRSVQALAAVTKARGLLS